MSPSGPKGPITYSLQNELSGLNPTNHRVLLALRFLFEGSEVALLLFFKFYVKQNIQRDKKSKTTLT